MRVLCANKCVGMILHTYTVQIAFIYIHHTSSWHTPPPTHTPPPQHHTHPPHQNYPYHHYCYYYYYPYCCYFHPLSYQTALELSSLIEQFELNPPEDEHPDFPVPSWVRAYAVLDEQTAAAQQRYEQRIVETEMLVQEHNKVRSGVWGCGVVC